MSTTDSASSLGSQVSCILNDKIKRICQSEFKKANPKPTGKHRPYSVPSCVSEMVSMISECADESTTNERLNEIYTFATSGDVFEKSFPFQS